MMIVKFERNENIPQKNEKILEQTYKCLTENQLTLNADKTIILIRIQNFLIKVKLSNQIMHVVIWEYKLIQMFSSQLYSLIFLSVEYSFKLLQWKT